VAGIFVFISPPFFSELYNEGKSTPPKFFQIFFNLEEIFNPFFKEMGF